MTAHAEVPEHLATCNASCPGSPMCEMVSNLTTGNSYWINPLVRLVEFEAKHGDFQAIRNEYLAATQDDKQGWMVLERRRRHYQGLLDNHKHLTWMVMGYQMGYAEGVVAERRDNEAARKEGL